MQTSIHTACKFLFLFIVIPALSIKAYSQEKSFSAFSDLHIHTSFKNYYRYIPNPDSTIADVVKGNRRYSKTNWLPFEKDIKDKKEGKESNLGNYDQANYANLKGLSGSVLCLSITPLEKVMLASKSDRWINFKFVTHMSLKRQGVIADENNSSFKEFLGEYYYTISQDSVHNGTKILLAKNNADLRRIISEGGIGLVMTIEGGHVLFGNDILSKLDNVKSSGCDTPCRNEILGNIDKLRALGHHVFFITAAHFGWNKMFGNAKSLDKPGMRRGLLTMASLSDGFKDAVFAKYGDGIIGTTHEGAYTDTSTVIGSKKVHVTIPYAVDDRKTDLGYAVIDKLLDAEHDYKNPIYIDVKHMDIKARFQYYNLIDSLNKIRKAEGKKLIPIIASHIGLSGKKRPVAFATALYPLNDSYEELIFGPVFYKVQANEHDDFWRAYTKMLPEETRALYVEHYNKEIHTSFNPFADNINLNTIGWFYPWGINFCDEEIKHIYASDGIIGLNLDRRILGFTMPNYDWRYKKYLRRKFKNTYDAEALKTRQGLSITFEEYYLSEPLLRNIFHVIETCGVEDSTAWNHIAIGSDYDGFIQPIKLSPTAESIPVFHKKMIAFLEIFVEIHNKKDLLYGLSPKQAMEKFFYLNGKNFIFKYFQE
jgi:microsomal dipeptidase-like Zn-dependent dipeptidase